MGIFRKHAECLGCGWEGLVVRGRDTCPALGCFRSGIAKIKKEKQNGLTETQRKRISQLLASASRDMDINGSNTQYLV